MYLELYERRSRNRLVTNGEVKQSITSESTCMFCHEKDCVEPTGVLTQNVHGLTDDGGQPMMEQCVVCRKCGEKWVDVFYQIYPPPDKRTS